MTGTTRIVTVKADFNRCSQQLNLLELEGYKKTFQNFWVQFVEQFVPATTIFVSGERWCNRPEDICTQYEECDFDFEFVDGDVTTIPGVSDTGFEPTPSDDSTDVEPNTGDEPIDETVNPVEQETTETGPITTRNYVVNPLPDEEGEKIEQPSVINDVPGKRERMDNYRRRLQPTETIIE